MGRKWIVSILVGALTFSVMSNVFAGPKRDHDKIRHVLLISIDGMHAVDFKNCVASKTCPHLAELGETGVNYTRTTTSRPSDSFPGLMALITGGTPRTVGAFYDVAYDRVLAPRRRRPATGCQRGTAWKGLSTERRPNMKKAMTSTSPSSVVASRVIPLSTGE